MSLFSFSQHYKQNVSFTGPGSLRQSGGGLFSSQNGGGSLFGSQSGGGSLLEKSLSNVKSVFTAMNSEKIPPKLRNAYCSIRFVAEKGPINARVSIFEAKSKITGEIHIIKVLTLPSAQKTNETHTRGLFSTFLQADWKEDVAATLFIQELLHLCSTQPELVIINSFIMVDNTLAYSLRSTTTLKAQFIKQKSKTEEKSGSINIPKIISDVVTELEILWKERKVRGFGASIQKEDIYYDSSKQKYWLGNWTNVCSQSMIVTSYEEDNSENEPLASQDISEELSTLAMTLIELKGMNRSEMEKLRRDFDIPESEYLSMMTNQLSKYFQEEGEMSSLLLRLVSRDRQKLPTINKLKEMNILRNTDREGLKNDERDLPHNKIEELSSLEKKITILASSLKTDPGNLNRSFSKER